MRRGAEPCRQGLERRPEVFLPPREVLAERSCGEIAGPAKRGHEGHAARRVRKAAAPDGIRLQQRGAVQRAVASHDAEAVRASQDVDAAIHRLQLGVGAPGGGRRTGARRGNGLQSRDIRRLRSRRGQTENDRGEGLGDSHDAVVQQMPLRAESCAFLPTLFTFRFSDLTKTRREQESPAMPPDSRATRGPPAPSRGRARARRAARSSRCVSSAAPRRRRLGPA